MNCHLSYRGSIARIAILLDMPDCRCLKLTLVRRPRSRQSFAMAKVFHLCVKTGSISRSTEITADSHELL